MAFVKKTWKDRLSQYPNRRTINDGIIQKTVTVARAEGTVTEAGDSFNAANMNDLEDRIEAGINAAAGASSLDELSDVDITTPTNNQVLRYDADSGKWVNVDGGGDYTAGENISIVDNEISVTDFMTSADAHTLWANT